MKALHLNSDVSIFEETEKLLPRIKKTRKSSNKDAFDQYNHVQKRMILGKRLNNESDLINNDSFTALKDFDDFDNAD